MPQILVVPLSRNPTALELAKLKEKYKHLKTQHNVVILRAPIYVTIP
jgi:hypothetical protein